ncbi:MAG TPA: hypothetical protein VF405_00385 [Gammaproteobacteria bacterium]
METKAFKLVAFAAAVACVAACSGGGSGDASNNSTSTPRNTAAGPPPPEFYAAPTRVTDSLRFAAVAAGYHHTCAIEVGGDTYCWGSNEHGQLGSTAAMGSCAGGQFKCSGSPVRVESGLRFVLLAASIRHTCGLDSAGNAYCWGFGLGGQLGDGLRQNSTQPVAVAGGLRFATLAASIASGSTCGLTAIGDAWCWGTNVGGELGNGTKTDLQAMPGPLATSTKLKSLSLGQQHACAVDMAGNALCWGNNWFGQLGVGSAGGANGFAESFTPVAVLGGLKFEEIVAAGMHTCALQSSGRAHCWGNGEFLGAGVAGYQSLPVPVLAAGSPWQSLRRGYAQTCARTPNGELDCWGQRTSEAGGVAAVPTRIASPQPFVDYTSGGTHDCAIGADGFAYCWGSNWWGQVGRPPSDP